jgi:hypothetical protein
MKLDGKVKGGLAWAGLVIVLAVPAADMIFGKPTDSAAAVTSETAATATDTKAPALKAPVAGTDPIQTASVDEAPVVDKFLKSGKKLPSYISDADEVQPVANAAPATAPAVKPPVAVTTPTTVATAPAETPPIPLPRSARPQGTQVAALPADEKPLIIDQPTVKPPQQAAVEPFPMSSDDEVVTGDQLEEWDSGSLADYLERKGLMTEASSQTVDEDSFYIDEAPRRPVRRPLEDFLLF